MVEGKDKIEEEGSEEEIRRTYVSLMNEQLRERRTLPPATGDIGYYLTTSKENNSSLKKKDLRNRRLRELNVSLNDVPGSKVMNRIKKLTSEEVKEYIILSVEALIRGVKLKKIRQDLINEGLTPRQAQHILDKARDQKSWDKDVAFQKSMAMRRFESALEKAYELNDYKSITIITKEIIEFLGIAEPKKSEHTIISKPISQMNEEEIKALLESAEEEPKLLEDGKNTTGQ